jgi:hypothetical protein
MHSAQDVHPRSNECFYRLVVTKFTAFIVRRDVMRRSCSNVLAWQWTKHLSQGKEYARESTWGGIGEGGKVG